MYNVYIKSKWYKSKPQAIKLRRLGKSLPFIHHQLGIPKSTLSYWFKDIELTKVQKEKLHNDWQSALVKARKEAIVWHNTEKTKRLQKAQADANLLLDKINIYDKNIIELALAILYLGEGTKAKSETGMGSSDPLILKFFIFCLRKIYHVPESKIKCELHLRADQDQEKMVTYWSNQLGVARENFTKPYLDKRTQGKATYDSYHGVCLIRCGHVAIQRKLVYIAKHFCDQIPTKV